MQTLKKHGFYRKIIILYKIFTILNCLTYYVYIDKSIGTALFKDGGGGSDMAPRGGGRAKQDMFE
jgi:hypothetical protein